MEILMFNILVFSFLNILFKLLVFDHQAHSQKQIPKNPYNFNQNPQFSPHNKKKAKN